VADTDPFWIELPPDADELRGLRDGIADWLRAAGIEDAVRDAVVLATHEAAASAMGSPGDVEVAATRDEHAITVTVTSEDGWTSPDDDLGGRRMSVVRELVNEATFEKISGRPRLRLEKQL
jgi:hypothetical protein